MHGTVAPHDMLPGTEGDSDNQNVPPSRSSTFIKSKKSFRDNNDMITKTQKVIDSLSNRFYEKPNEAKAREKHKPCPYHRRLCNIHLRCLEILSLKYQIVHMLDIHTS